MEIAEFRIAAGPGAPAAIRRAVDDIAFLPEPVAGDLRRLAAALATSRTLGGRADAPPSVHVRVSRADGVTRVEMSTVTAPERGLADAPATGRPLLDRACPRWGMARLAVTMLVWFELEDPADAPAVAHDAGAVALTP
jgi:hypothetical protein